MSQEQLNLSERPVRLNIHPTDTDSHASVKILFMDPETSRITGPVVADGDRVSVFHAVPEAYLFSETLAFLVHDISGTIVFKHEKGPTGEVLKSPPTEVYFSDGSFHAEDPKTHELWEQPFAGCRIDLRVNRADSVSVEHPAYTADSVSSGIA